MAPSVRCRGLLSVITTSNNPELSGQRLRRIEVPTLDGPQAELRQPCGGSPKRRPAPGTAGGAHAPIRCRSQRNAQGRSATMGQARRNSPTLLIGEDDAEVRSLAATLFEDEHLDIIECESAEAALAIMLIGGAEVGWVFPDARSRWLGRSWTGGG